MKSNITLRNRSFQRDFFAVVTSLMLCTIVIHTSSVHATESRTFSIISNPASATYLDDAHEKHSIASNVVGLMVTPAEPLATMGSIASAQSNPLFAQAIVQANYPGSKVHSSNFNASWMDRVQLLHSLFLREQNHPIVRD